MSSSTREIEATAQRPTLEPPAGKPGAVGAGGYRRSYRLAGDPGQCLLQRVSVDIRYSHGDEPCVIYRGTYFEFFRFSGAGASIRDTHDFDLNRDRWSQADILRLLRRHRVGTGGASAQSSEPALEVRKSFLLGLGEVAGERPLDMREPGVEFGFIEHCGSSSAHAAITLHPTGATQPIPLNRVPACPWGYRPAGDGRFVGVRGWRADERYSYCFSTMSGKLRSDGEYRGVAIQTAMDHAQEGT